MNSNRPVATLVLAVFALAGAVFSAVSTHDYIAFLDRQVHPITCSFVPGLGPRDTAGTSGCHVVLMSPYSAVLRSFTWGGIPIALPALAVFAFLLFRAVDLLARRRTGDTAEARFTLLATALPLVVSIVYFVISTMRIGVLCKLCVGIYLASLGAFAAAWTIHRHSVPSLETDGRPRSPWGAYGRYFVEGVAFVFVPVLLYLGLKPAYGSTLGKCGELMHPEDRYGVLVKLTTPPGGVPAIEVLDPLCPACKGFAQRLDASGLADRFQLDAALFPLDKECNWMVSESLHPGSCVMSEAVLCGGVQASDVLDWAFAHQEELRRLGRTDKTALLARITEAFPQLAGCVGRSTVRARLNRSLRWVVNNSLPVLTPQLFVRGQKVCEEDTDLGLEYVLTRMLAREALAPRLAPAR